MSGHSSTWISAAEACRLLAVRRATLYAYVSRGFIRSQPSPRSPRERAYAREDVARLRRRVEARREPDTAAAHALEWGMPVLESSISLIDGQRLYFRGLDAIELARSRTLEEVAALIWLGRLEAAMPAAAARHIPRRATPRASFISQAQALLAAAAPHDPQAMDLRAARVAQTGARIMRLLTLCAGAAATSASHPLHRRLARTWHLDEGGADLIRAALVLCADHELNVSSFTARCVASAGSHPYAVVIAALSALEGPKHGGAGARVESTLDAMRRVRALPQALAARLRRGEPIDGFGHPLYRDGDPRARLLLDLLRERYATHPELRFVAAFAETAAEVTGEHPNLDFGLAAVARVLQLPAGSPLKLFAIGRSVGWIGHAIEQYATGQLIRPRAKYTGVAPVIPPSRPEPPSRDTRPETRASSRRPWADR
jgi:citrate synthase